MSIVKQFVVKHIEPKNNELLHTNCIEFVKNKHYSGTCPNSSYHLFGMFFEASLIGVAVFAKPTGRYQEKAYGTDIELTRLVLLDWPPRNSETYFLSRCIKWLKKNTNFKSLLSLADGMESHEGTIYKAANFEQLRIGIKKRIHSFLINKEKVHCRTCYGRWGTSSEQKLKNMFGESNVVPIKGVEKHVFRYNLRDKK